MIARTSHFTGWIKINKNTLIQPIDDPVDLLWKWMFCGCEGKEDGEPSIIDSHFQSRVILVATRRVWCLKKLNFGRHENLSIFKHDRDSFGSSVVGFCAMFTRMVNTTGLALCKEPVFLIRIYEDNSCRSTSCNESLNLNPNAQSNISCLYALLCVRVASHGHTAALAVLAMSEGGELRTRSESGPSPHVTLRV